MCVISKPKVPKVPDVQLPPEPQQAKSPDGGTVTTNVARRVTDRQRAATQTILTSSSGVLESAPTEKKTLLGG